MPLNLAAFESKIDQSSAHHLWKGSVDQSGTGQIRVDGKLRSPAQIAWELSHGDIPVGHRVYACPDVRLCIHPEHIFLKRYGNRSGGDGPIARRRAERGNGSIRQLSKDKWKLTVDAGRDQHGKRRRITRTVHGTHKQAVKSLAALVTKVDDGTTKPRPTSSLLTVDQLVDWYVPFASEVRGLEHSTLFGYREVYNLWLRPEIGHIDVNRLKPAQVDISFGKMREAGLSRSRMNNARSLLTGAFKWGRRHDKTTGTPFAGFELPTSVQSPQSTTAPEADDLIKILTGAEEHEPELSPVVHLAATTGMRRGELAGLRRDRIRLDSAELVVDTSVNDAGGTVVIKKTKTKRDRVVSLDNGTIEMLLGHILRMNDRASDCGVEIAVDAFVFSLDPACAEPMRPEFMTRHMRLLRKKIGITSGDFDATILALRKWTTTELMDAGFNPSTVSGRQGHTVQVMLQHYLSRRRSADQAAAEHLGQRVYQSRAKEETTEP